MDGASDHDAKLAEIVHRLDRVESCLAELTGRMDRADAARTGTSMPMPQFTPPTAPPTTATETIHRHTAPSQPPVMPPQAPHPIRPTSEAASAGAPRLATIKASLRATPTRAPTPSAAREHLERLIGGRWYAIVGAIVVIIGVALFFQYAVQQGWLQRVPPSLKCMGGAVFGCVLIALAEIMRRRINDWAAAGLYAAGLGTIYVSAYAAFARYDLVGSTPAFIMLALCAAAGIGLGARARLVAVSLAALLGSYLAPILIHTDAGRAYVLPPYWVTLLLIALALAGWRGGSFIAMRWLAWWATFILGFIWILSSGDEYPALALAFLTIVWVSIHVELWITSAQSTLGGMRTATGREGTTADLTAGTSTRKPGVRLSPAFSSFSITAWTTVLAVLVVRQMGSLPDWLAPAAGTIATAFCGLSLAGNLRLLRDMPRPQTEELGAGLILQAGALLIAAVALGLTGWAQVVAWIAMGIAAVATARWLDSIALWVYGIILLALASARLILYDAWAGTMPTRGLEFIGLVLSWWSGMMALCAAGWLAAALFTVMRVPELVEGDDTPRTQIEYETNRRFRFDIAFFRGAAKAIAGIGVALLVGSIVLHSTSIAITVAWMIIAAAVATAGVFRPSIALRFHALWAALLATAPWLIAFVGNEWPRFHDPPALHRGLVIAVALAVELILVGRVAARDVAQHARESIVAAGACVAVILVLVASSYETARVALQLTDDPTVRQAAVSIWWGIFAIALLAVGFVRRWRTVRQAGLLLLGIATAKALIFDLQNVALGWRVISVLALGMLMLAVGVVYARLSRSTDEFQGDEFASSSADEPKVQ